MLNNQKDTNFQSYGFRFKEEQQQNVAGIHSLGWEKETDPKAYDWDGMKRSEIGKVIFQYTLSGMGKINIDGTTTELQSGDAFFVDIPSQHRYFLPEKSAHWEFIFITTYGIEAERCFERIKNKYGQILHLDTASAPIKQIFDLIEKTNADNIKDAFELSAYAYAFLMKLFSHIQNSDNKAWPESVLKAIIFIQQRYKDPLTLDDIAFHAQTSKYHFTRVFQYYTHMTPMAFVTKTRMEHALKLLKDHTLSIEDITRQVGYANSNYFNKAFRSFIGVAPGKYRSGKSFLPFDSIITD